MKLYNPYLITYLFICIPVFSIPLDNITLNSSDKDSLLSARLSLDLNYDHKTFDINAHSNNSRIESIKVNNNKSLIFKNPEEEFLFTNLIKSVPKGHLFIIFKNNKNEVTSLKILGDVFRYELSHTREGETGPAHRHSKNALVDIPIPNNNKISSFDLYKSNEKIDMISSFFIDQN